jgi:hypothetical protein
MHEFRRQCGEDLGRRWPIYSMMTGGMPKVARIRRLSQISLVLRSCRSMIRQQILLMTSGTSAFAWARWICELLP